MTSKILEVQDLRTYFYLLSKTIRAVDGVTFWVNEGETHCLIGESSSGKTVTALSVLRIVPPPGKIVDGKIFFRGDNLLTKKEKEMSKIRGVEISMTFQDPSTSLDPIYKIGNQLKEVLLRHKNIDKKEAEEEVIKWLEMVNLPDPEVRFHQYPNELSIGMKQRVVLTRSLLCNSSLLILDEPTSNLDVTTQAQILDLIKNLKHKLKMSLLLITHNMGIVAYMADRITVLYAGQTCETGSSQDIFFNPKHPYTKALLKSVPQINVKMEDIVPIKGSIPDPMTYVAGCRFYERCEYATEVCREKVPPLTEIEKGHYIACARVN